MLEIYTDGASRGNGGESAASYIIYKDGKELIRGVRHIGLTTNNMAEYMAVHDAIEYCYLNMVFGPDENCTIISDSMLIINQLSGKWKINNHNLKEINHNIKFYLSKYIITVIYWLSLFDPKIQNKLSDNLNIYKIRIRSTVFFLANYYSAA